MKLKNLLPTLFLALTFLAVSAQAQFISVGVTVASDTSVVLHYNTSAPTTTIVQWGTTVALAGSVTVESIPSVTHTVTLTGLLPSTKYNWRVLATDKFGEMTTGNYQGFTTTSVSHTVALSWVPADPGYATIVLKATTSGGPYQTLTTVDPGTSVFTDKGVFPGRNYFYVVQSKDVPSGNTSVFSDEVPAPIPNP